MKYFLDTEFIEYPNTIELISIGIVNELGEQFYAINKDFNLNKVWKNNWLVANVLYPIYAENYSRSLREHIPFNKRTMRKLINKIGIKQSFIKNKLTLFFMGDDNPKLYSYYADYDWVVFCWLYGRMNELPAKFPQYCTDLKQMMDERNLDEKWRRENHPDPIIEHNALEDALWNKELYDKIIKRSMTGEELLNAASTLVGNPGANVSGSTDVACMLWHNKYEEYLMKKL